MYQITKIPGTKEHKEHPLVEKVISAITESDFFRRYGDPAKLSNLGLYEYGPVWSHITTEMPLILVHVRSHCDTKSLKGVLTYRNGPYYKELTREVAKLAGHINSKIGMDIAKESCMTACDSEAMVYIDRTLLERYAS